MLKFVPIHIAPALNLGEVSDNRSRSKDSEIIIGHPLQSGLQPIALCQWVEIQRRKASVEVSPKQNLLAQLPGAAQVGYPFSQFTALAA